MLLRLLASRRGSWLASLWCLPSLVFLASPVAALLSRLFLVSPVAALLFRLFLA